MRITKIFLHFCLPSFFSHFSSPQENSEVSILYQRGVLSIIIPSSVLQYISLNYPIRFGHYPEKKREKTDVHKHKANIHDRRSILDIPLDTDHDTDLLDNLLLMALEIKFEKRCWNSASLIIIMESTAFFSTLTSKI